MWDMCLPSEKKHQKNNITLVFLVSKVSAAQLLIGPTSTLHFVHSTMTTWDGGGSGVSWAHHSGPKAVMQVHETSRMGKWESARLVSTHFDPGSFRDGDSLLGITLTMAYTTYIHVTDVHRRVALDKYKGGARMHMYFIGGIGFVEAKLWTGEDNVYAFEEIIEMRPSQLVKELRKLTPRSDSDPGPPSFREVALYMFSLTKATARGGGTLKVDPNEQADILEDIERGAVMSWSKSARRMTSATVRRVLWPAPTFAGAAEAAWHNMEENPPAAGDDQDALEAWGEAGLDMADQMNE